MEKTPGEEDARHLGAVATTDGYGESSRSYSNGDCVEGKIVDGTVYIRDGKDPGGPVLLFPANEWQRFIRGLLANEITARDC